MAIGVRLPDDQEEEVEKVVERENYPSKSEFIREALRNELRRRKNREQLLEVKQRMQDDSELKDHEEVMEDSGLRD